MLMKGVFLFFKASLPKKKKLICLSVLSIVAFAMEKVMCILSSVLKELLLSIVCSQVARVQHGF